MRISISNNVLSLLSLTVILFAAISVAVFFWVMFDGRPLTEVPAIELVAILIIILLLSIVFLVSSALKNNHTVHTLKMHQYDLEESKDRFLWLYRNSPVPYVTIDKKGKIIFPNLAALRLFQLKEEALVSRELTEFISDETENDQSVLYGRLQTYVTVNETEVQITIADGSYRWILLSVFMYGETGERLATLVDITKQRQVDQAKSEFVSFASHQLRTPISAIRWNLELLGAESTGGLNEKQLTYFEKINRNAGKMVALVDDFLNVSKLELGTFATEVIEIELFAFFGDIMDEFQQRIHTKNLAITTHFSESPYTVHADSRLLHIVISNLVSNAVKYTEEEGSVTVGYEKAENHTVITVADSGMGIPAGEINNLFSRFFRASNAVKNVSDGTGLGLYIVKQSVLLMGGTIDFQSKEGEGTTFTVRLPL